MNVSKLLAAAADQWPDKSAVIYKDHKTSYKALYHWACRWAQVLVDAGAKQEQRIAVLIPNQTEFVVAYQAIAMIPAVFIPIDLLLKGEEMAEILADLEPSMLLVDDSLTELLEQALAELGKEIPSLTLSKVEQLSATKPDNFPVPEPDEDKAAVILYTSGTVGGSKGVVLSYRCLGFTPNAIRQAFGLNETSVYSLVVPMSHISGPVLANLTTLCGSALLIHDRFTPRKFLQELFTHGATISHMVPPMMKALLTVKEWEKYPLDKLQNMFTFGMTAAPEILMAFKARYPDINIAGGYGLTETGPLITLQWGPAPANKLGSVGTLLDYAQVRLLDEEGSDLPLSGEGEIVTKGPHLMIGYWRNPELTAEKVLNGWFYTGDIGTFDEDGHLWILGRKKDVINVAGLKVYAPEVEDVLYKHEKVQEAAVVAVQDQRKGEQVKAVIMLKGGQEAEGQEFIDHCRAHLADYKVPKIVEVSHNPLPRSRTGKIRKEDLL